MNMNNNSNDQKYTLHGKIMTKDQKERALEFGNILDRIGGRAFADIFVKAHEDESYVVSPNEFFIHAEMEEMEDIKDTYNKMLRDMHIEFYRKYMDCMSKEVIIKTMAELGGLDIPNGVLNKIKIFASDVEKNKK